MSLAYIRSRVAALLFVTGALQIITFLLTAKDNSILITGVFGLIFLGMGYLMLRDGQEILYAGILIPLVEIALTAAGLATATSVPLVMAVVFILFDLLIIAGCVYLITRLRDRARAIRR